MNLILKYIIIIGGALLVAAFHFLYKYTHRFPEKRYDLIAKSGGGFTCALVAAVLMSANGINPFSDLIFWGLILCSIADTVLELNFLLGVVIFGTAHIMFILHLIQAGSFSYAVLIILAVSYCILLPVFIKDINKMEKGGYLLYIYPALLLFMASLSIGSTITNGSKALIVTIAGILFAFSDYQVGRQVFGYTFRYQGDVIMISYYLALFLFAVSTSVAII